MDELIEDEVALSGYKPLSMSPDIHDGVIKPGAKQLSMSPEGEDIKSGNEPSRLPQF